MKRYFPLLLIFSVLGCKTTTVEEPGIDEVLILKSINESLDAIADANRIRASLRSDAAKKRSRPLTTPKNLHINIPLGDEPHNIENLVSTVARMSNWDFEVRNRAASPPQGVIVLLHLQNPMAYSLILDAGEFADNFVDIVLTEYPPTSRTDRFGLIELIYK